MSSPLSENFLPTVLYKTTCITAISSHCHTALPAKMSGFKSDIRQNAYLQ